MKTEVEIRKLVKYYSEKAKKCSTEGNITGMSLNLMVVDLLNLVLNENDKLAQHIHNDPDFNTLKT